MTALDAFGPATRDWFRAAFAAPTPVQEAGWRRISAGEHALLLAPTGSGKTLAAFLWCLDRLHHHPRPDDAPAGVRVLYVSPLKALVYDVERNLRTPLAGIRASAARQSRPVPAVTVAMRTGDTPQRERRLLIRKPADVLVTTPESLYLLLTSKSREVLRTVETVIIDEIHAVASTKRGAHLSLSLERLSELCAIDPQRIGLSATQRPLDEIARFLGGDRPVAIVDTSAPPRMDLQVIVPVEDMEAPPEPDLEGALGEGGDVLMMDGGADPRVVGPLDHRPRSSLPGDRTGLWSQIHPRILDLIVEHRSTIVFANSRRLTERLAQRLNELAADRGLEPLARAHHGSISHRQRAEIEEALKRGDLPCIVATSSLELGIDMGAVDLVIQVESPGSVASGLQRVGRAGHGVGEVSVGRIFPKFRGDLLEAAVVVRGMFAGEVERTRVPRNALDVLAQQIVALCVTGPRALGEIERIVRRSYGYQALSREALVAVLDMLSGRMPLAPATHPDQLDAIPDERGFDEVRPLLTWDRATDTLRARKGARLTAIANAGTIPDRGLYGVFLAPDGPRVGQLDEEMVHEARAGEVFLLGASSWRITEIKRDRVLVTPAPGQPGKMPFWRGQGPGRPADLGRRIGEVVREVADRLEAEPAGEAACGWLMESCRLDRLAAGNLVAYIAEQRDAAGVVPTDRAITIEHFQDELGDWRVCLLSPFGSRVNAPWALAIQARLQDRVGGALQVLWTDDGIILRVPEAELLPDLDDLIPDLDELDDLVTGRLGESPVFAASFREAAGRALLLPKRRPGARVPLWLQRMKAQNLMASALQHPTYPVVLEAYRECLQDVFDLPGLRELLTAIRDRRVRLDRVETPTASPFARSLVFAFVASWLYEGDAPLAERRVQALTIDRALLRELLGSEGLRELLDADVIAELDAELQQLPEHRRARSADALHDLLRRLGDLSPAEVAGRCTDDPTPWLDALQRSRQAVSVRVGGEPRWIALDDAGRYRDGLGTAPPGGLPAAFLEPVPHAFESLLLRYARTHGPFLASAVARRWALAVGPVVAGLDALEARGQLLSGAFLPGGDGTEREYCDPQVMRRIKRRTLARLRGEIEPVEAATLGRFLPAWQGLAGEGARREAGAPAARHEALLLDALGRLEGCPIPFSELEARVLPARVPGYAPHMLDQLGARGELVWAGRGSLGPSDGRVVLVRRDQAAVLLDPPGAAPDDPVQRSILDAIEQQGACFFFELERRVGAQGAAVRAEVLQEALWALVWAGHLTNDTLQPLRGLKAPRRKRGRSAARPAWRRGPRAAWSGAGGAGPTGGRWSRVQDLLDDRVTDTDRGMARASALLDRYGVVGREVAAAEELRGGFSSILPVLYELEEAGQVRQGWFVAGLGGAQFAVPGAVDRLRTLREPDEVVRCLAATDPGQPYGAVAPWPEPADGAPPPRREAGATVALWGGEPVLWLGRGGRSLLTFEASEHPRRLQAAVRALAAALPGRSSVTIQSVDGSPPHDAARFAALVAAGFSREGAGLRLAAPL